MEAAGIEPASRETQWETPQRLTKTDDPVAAYLQPCGSTDSHSLSPGALEPELREIRSLTQPGDTDDSADALDPESRADNRSVADDSAAARGTAEEADEEWETEEETEEQWSRQNAKGAS